MKANFDLDWVTRKYEEEGSLKYIFFWGHTPSATDGAVGKFIFSQWHPASFTVDNITYATAEHWMMAQKAKLFGDEEIFSKIVASSKPAVVKQFGREIGNFDEKIWSEKRFEIVVNGNYHKFNQHQPLKDYLLGTGDRIIVEASPVDAIWGIGKAQDSPNVNNPSTWSGLNLLGFALMEVRERIMAEAKN